MLYLILKAVHVVFMVSYFAGLFYLVRLYVYYKDTDEFEQTKKEVLRAQYVYMARRLWNIITVPAFIIMLLSGLWLIFYYYPSFPLLTTDPISWFYIKIFFLLFLFMYHYWSWKTLNKMAALKGASLNIANIKLRQSNEIATFLLFLIVFTVLLKTAVLTYYLELIIGFAILVLTITTIVKLVNRRKKS